MPEAALPETYHAPSAVDAKQLSSAPQDNMSSEKLTDDTPTMKAPDTADMSNDTDGDNKRDTDAGDPAPYSLEDDISIPDQPKPRAPGAQELRHRSGGTDTPKEDDDNDNDNGNGNGNGNDAEHDDKEQPVSQRTLYRQLSKKYRPNNRYVFDFPQWLDSVLQPLDATATEICQNLYQGRVTQTFASLFTIITAVETALGLPFMAFALGYDGLGTVSMCMLLALGFVSQLPKRFLWRPRPWMMGRARKVRTDKTSSFPSRAIGCGVVFPVMLLYGYGVEVGRHAPAWVYALSIVVVVLSTTYARVNVGAHYFSDTIGGLLLSVVCCWVGFWMIRSFNYWGCGFSNCYAADPSMLITRANFFQQINTQLLVGSIVTSFVVTVVSIVAPISFWLKNSYVYGLLFSCVTFKFVFLCPTLGKGTTLGALPSQDFMNHVTLIMFAAAFVLGGKVIEASKKGKHELKYVMLSVIKFAVIYFGVLGLMVGYRL